MSWYATSVLSFVVEIGGISLDSCMIASDLALSVLVQLFESQAIAIYWDIHIDLFSLILYFYSSDSCYQLKGYDNWD